LALTDVAATLAVAILSTATARVAATKSYFIQYQ